MLWLQVTLYTYFHYNIFCFKENPNNSEELQAFRNLVLLFSELMEHGVFSHDLYINMLISQRDIAPGIVFCKLITLCGILNLLKKLTSVMLISFLDVVLLIIFKQKS